MINHVDINKIVISNKLPFGKKDFKYFTDYKDSEKNRSLYIFCPQSFIYSGIFDENKCIFNKRRKRFY